MSDPPREPSIADRIVEAVAAASADPAALIAGLRGLCDAAERDANIAGAVWHLIVISDDLDEDVIRETFPDAPAMAARLRDLQHKPVRVCAFFGLACRFTQPPEACLVTHEGRYPLFDAAPGGEATILVGHLGPAVPPRPPAPAAGPAHDEEEPDDYDEEGDEEGSDDDDL